MFFYKYMPFCYCQISPLAVPSHAFGVLIGVTLGALGAGGSILAVPVLVHVVGLSVPTATATSLVAVGSAAAVAAWGHRSRVDRSLAVWFVAVGGIGSLGGAFVGRRLADDVVLLAFSVLVLVAAHRMLTACPSCTRAGEDEARARQRVGGGGGVATAVDTPRVRVAELVPMVGAGLLVGALTGLFGVGGGFVIVPILTLVMTRNIPTAIATSLVIVAGNSLVAVLLRGVGSVDWGVAAAFTVPMLVGSLAGSRLAHRLDAQRSLRAFATILVLVAAANALSVLL